MSTCSRVITAPSPIRAPVAPRTNDSRMKLSLPGQKRDPRGWSLQQRAVSTNLLASNLASLIATTANPQTPRALTCRARSSRRQRRLQLEQDQRQADLRDRLVILQGDARIERLAEVRRDREDEECVGAGCLEVARLADGGSVEGPARPATIGRSVTSFTISRTRTFSSRVRCGPSPVSTLIASATGPCSAIQPM